MTENKHGNPMVSKHSKLLIMKLDHIGDMVLTTPLIEAIKKRYPHCFLAVMCSATSASVLRGNPYVDKIYHYQSPMFDRDNTIGSSEYKSNICSLNEVRNERFDIAIDLRGDLFNIPLLRITRAQCTLSFNNYSHFSGMLDLSLQKKENEHETRNQFKLLGLIDVPEPSALEPKLFIKEEEQEWALDFLKEKGIREDSKFIAISPGGGWFLNWWPWQNFALLCNQIMESYPDVHIVLVGGAKERVIASRILASTSDNVKSAVGETNIHQLAALLSCAMFTVTNDGGPMHISTGVNTPVIALFGPSPNERFGPLGKNNAIITKKYSCSPCPQFIKGHSPSCTDNRCMQAITVSEIFDHVKIMLRNNRITRAAYVY